MKKFYCYAASLLVAAGAMVGCTEDITTDNNLSNEGLNNVEFIEVTADLEVAESRTTLTDGGNGGKAVWSEGDAIAAIDGDGNVTECVATSVDGTSATFSVPANTKYAVYPYLEDRDAQFINNNGYLAHTLESTVSLDGSNRVFSDKENTMVAHLVDKNLSFKHLCGYIEVKLKGTGTVKHVALRSNTKNWNQQTLAGLQYIDITNAAAPKFYTPSGQAKTWSFIYATCSNVELSTSEATSFYFVVPPHTYENLSICVQTDKGSYAVTTKNAIEVNRAMIRPISAINIDNLKPATATDLSADGIANCYVVPQGTEAKYYSFPAQKLNATEKLANAAYAHMVWSDGKQLVSNVCYDASTGKVTFKYEGNNAEGNALVSVFDANHTLLWSWHIWCTDKPQLISVANSSGSKVYGVLDRNLGATYTPKTVAEATGISETDATASMGLYYQYGRHTPFPKATSIKNTTTEASAFDANTTNYALMYGFGNYFQQFVYSAMTNPEHILVCTFDNMMSRPNVFGVVSFTDNKATTVNSGYKSTNSFCLDPYNACDVTARQNTWHSENADQITKKGTNDPCPAGYIMDEGFGIGYVNGFNYNVVKYGTAQANTYGYYYECPKAGGLVWIPAAGFRHLGKYQNIGQEFDLWTVSTNSNTAALYTIRLYAITNADNSVTTVKPAIAGYNTTSIGFNVRCRVMDRTALQK